MATTTGKGGFLSRALSLIGVGGSAVRNVRARYEAAGQGRRMRGWNPPTSGPNTAIKGLQKIRDRARDSTRNDWTGESGVQKWATSLIGTGIVPRFKRLPAKRRIEVTQLWSDWVRVADADGVLNFYGLQSLAVRSWLESGEVFIRRRSRDASDGLPVPLQVQLIEADQVPLLDTVTMLGMPPGNRIESGIEFDRRGQRVAYWMYREHPGDPKQGAMIDPSKLLRIKADEVIHMFEPKRIGQRRGVSVMSAILARLRNIENFDDAVLTRQMLANLFAMFIKQEAGTTDFDDETDPLTGKPIETDENGPIAALEPGISQRLLPGEDVVFANPPEPGTTYSDYIRTQHLGTAAGQGLPYELFSGDIQNVSDRALRIIINEFRRFAEQRQWQVVIPMMCERVMGWFAEACAFVALVSASEGFAVKGAEWAPHGWAYIHPVQDVEGKAAEVDNGFRSRSSVIAERGDDPDAVDAERSADKKRADALGLAPPAPKPAGGSKTPAGNDGEDPPAAR